MATNYLTGKQAVISPPTLAFLSRMETWKRESEVRALFASSPGSARLMRDLLASDLLVRKHSAVAELEQAVDRSWAWGREAREFHYSTQRTRFLSLKEERARLLAMAKSKAAPSLFCRRRGRVTSLPYSTTADGPDFWTTIARRRTVRTFTGDAVSAEAFTRVLRSVWGVTHCVRDPVLGRYVLKNVPSGGARHPIEAYVAVLNVVGIAPGIYHYHPIRNEITEIKTGRLAREVVRACADQHWVSGAAFVCFMTAVLARSMWKYESSHAYRVVLLDAGHLGQQFHLVCTQLGLGPFTTAALHAREVEKLLGIDGVREIAVYAAAAGVPDAPLG